MHILTVLTELITEKIRRYSYRPFIWNTLEVLGGVVGVWVKPQTGQRSTFIDDARVDGQPGH